MGSTKIVAGLAIIIATNFLVPGESRLLCGLEVEFQGFNPIEALQVIQTRQMQEFDKYKETLSQLKFNVLSEDFLAWKQCLSEYEKEKVQFAATAAKMKLTFLSMVQKLTSQKLEASQYQQELEKLLQQFDTAFRPAVETFKTNIENLFETIQDENRRRTWWSSVKNKVSKTVDKVSSTVGSARSSLSDSSTDQQSGLYNKIKSVSGNIVAGSANMLSKTSSFVASKLGNAQAGVSPNGKYESMNQQVKEGYDSSSQRSIEDESQQQKPAIMQENKFSETSQSVSRSDYEAGSKGSSRSQTKDVGQPGYTNTRSGLQGTNGEVNEIGSETTREENVAETSGNQSNYGNIESKTKEVKKEETSYMRQTGSMGTYDEDRKLEYGKTRSGLEDTYGELKEKSSEVTREEKVAKTSEKTSNYDGDGLKSKEVKKEESSYFGKIGNYNENRQLEYAKTRSDSADTYNSGNTDTYGGIKDKNSACSACPCDCSKTGTSYSHRRRRSLINDIDEIEQIDKTGKQKMDMKIKK
uniref:Uncharacterized protein n=1 Tax=Cacopsylla melanoneura TaxID=428564 RepID=A0A8D8WBU5_9HEMI